ncbi:hypothetical protein [Dietzia massiliensis]|uniref:hypothetical protein n=1 Tax=Dietzia massiliensis TaxID=2697499 RepID=UPI001BCDA8BA|nr:hypothetical protein [Dietzia massiliensis]MBS7547904.1 hypothetical protein [Dietzia massiliensis]
MAPRQTARRILVAGPALALAFAVAACSPNQEPADPDAPYTLPTYSEESAPHSSIPETQETDDPDTIEDFEAGTTATGIPGEGGDEGGGQATTDDGLPVPGAGQQAGSAVPTQPAP